MFVPIIVGSDKTTVSVATGANEFWPIYGSIGNVHNNIRRAHGAGLVLIGFLSIPKGVFLFPLIVSQLIFCQPTNPMRLVLNSGDFGANSFIYHYRKFLNRFNQEWKLRKSRNVLMDIFDGLFGVLVHTLQTI